MSDRKNLNQDDRNAKAQVFGEEPDPSGIHRTSDEIYTGQEYQSSARKDEKEKKDSVIKDILILVMITLVAGCLLGAAYGVIRIILKRFIPPVLREEMRDSPFPKR